MPFVAQYGLSNYMKAAPWQNLGSGFVQKQTIPKVLKRHMTYLAILPNFEIPELCFKGNVTILVQRGLLLDVL